MLYFYKPKSPRRKEIQKQLIINSKKEERKVKTNVTNENLKQIMLIPVYM